MSKHIEQIEFHGERYWLLPGGSIATPDAFLHGHESYAHLMGGVILRYGHQIGTDADIVRLGPVPDALTMPDDIEEWLSNLLRWAT